MGTSAFDKVLPPAPPSTTPTAPATAALDAVLGEAEQEEAFQRGQLTVATSKARHANVGAMSEAFGLAKRTGLPVAVVARNLEQVRAQAGDQHFDPVAFQQEHPATARWLSTETNAAVSKDDWTNLGAIERLIGRWGRAPRVPFAQRTTDPFTTVQPVLQQSQRGLLQAEYQRESVVLELGRIGLLPPAERESMRALQAELEARRAEVLPDPANVVERFTMASAKILPSMVESVTAGGVGAAVGGGVGFVAGGPAGAALGAKVGGSLNAFLAAATMEGGNAALEFEKLTDDSGQVIDPGMAYGYGMAYGVASGAVELVGLRFIAEPFANAGRSLFRGAVSNALTRPTTRAALLGGTKAWATAVGGETATEVIQTGLQLTQEAELRAVSNWLHDTDFSAIPLERVGRELAETAIETAIGMTLLGIPGGSVSMVEGMARVTEAEAAQDQLTALGEGATASALRERAPEAFRELIQADIETHGPVRNVFISTERLLTVLEQENITPEQFAERAGLAPEALEQAAVLTGADLAIPLADYTAGIAGTPLHEMLTPDLKLRVGALSAREAEAMKATVEQDAEAVKAEMEAVAETTPEDASAQAVVADLTAKLEATGVYTPEQVGLMAKAASAPYIVLAKRLGQDPMALYQSRRLSIFGPERAGPLYDVTRAVQAAEARGASPDEVMVLRQRLNALSNDRVSVRAALEIADQTEDVRDAAGRLKRSLRQVSTDALVLEYLTLRDQVNEAAGQLSAFESDPQMAAAQTLAGVGRDEEAQGAYEDANGSGAVWSFVEMQALLRESRTVVRRYERTVPRLEAELRERGVTDPDAYAETHELRGDASFDVEAMGQAFEQSPTPPSQAETDVRAMLARQATALQRATAFLKKRGALSEAELAEVARVIGQPVEIFEQAQYSPETGIVLDEGEGMVQWRPTPRLPWIVMTASGPLQGAWSTPEQAEAALQKAGLVPAQPPAPSESTSETAADGAQLRLLQSGRSRPNAFILPGKAEQVIGLMETANLSSFLHEMGHEYLNLLAFVAQQPDAPQSVKDDLATFLTEVGKDSFDQVGVKEQEHFARAFESYLMSGQAPSVPLLRAFTRFRIWLTRIYAQAKAALVPVSPELRGVFDRLLATDEEIAATTEANAAGPMFESAADGAMTDAEFAAYQAHYDLRDAEASAHLAKRILAERDAGRTDEWQSREEEVRETVSSAVDAEPVEQAVRYFKTGTRPDGTVDAAPQKLAKSVLVPLYGDGITKTLPRGTFSVEGGVDPDAVALTFGFDTGDALVDALQSYEPRAKKIDRLVNQVMRREFPDLLGDSPALADAAQQAMHLADTDNVLLADLRALGRSSGQRPPNVAAFKRVARDIIGATAGRDLQPQRFLNAEATAGRKAYEAIRKGDRAQAAFHKRQQLMNHILYREAKAAQAAADKTLRFFARMEKGSAQSRLGFAGSQYQSAMNALLDAYEFRRVSLRKLDKRESLKAWREAQLAQGIEVAIPASVLEDAERVNYRLLTVDELQGVLDTAQQIWHTATMKDKLLDAKEKRTMQELEDTLRTQVETHTAIEMRDPDYGATGLDKAKKALAMMDAWHLKPEFLFLWLDGEATLGPWHQTFMQRFRDAEQAEKIALEAALPALQALFDMIPQAQHKDYLTRRTVPGLPFRATHAQSLALALNWGNDGNRAAVLAGRKGTDGPALWSEAHVNAALAVLTRDEWLMVQATWDYIDTFWPEIAALQQRMTGVVPQKVERVPFSVKTADGHILQLQGGYYPLVYDRSLNGAHRAEEARATVQDMGATSYTRGVTKHGHTEERVGSGGRPVQLDLNVLTSHVLNVIHDLTHREAIVDARRMLERPGVREAIEGTAGPALYDQLNPWLNRMANDRVPPGTELYDRFLSRARVGVTAVNMGWKVTTALVQPVGYLNTVNAIGAKYARRGLQAFFRNPRAAWQQAQAMSTAVRHRPESFDRDIRDWVKTRVGRGDKITKFQRSLFFLTSFMDMAVVVPSWIGAYQQSFETLFPGDHDQAVRYADSIIETTQSAGGAKDLARIQGGSELLRLFTPFYSYFSALYGQGRASGTTLARRGPKDLPRFLASMGLLWFGSAIISELIAGRGPEDDEDWAEWAAWEAARYPFSTVVVARDLARSIGPGGWDYQPSATFEAVASVGGVINTAVEATLADDGSEEVTASELKEMVNAAGYWLHLPSRQAWITSSYLYDWMMGYESPDTPVEAARNLALPRPR